MNCMFIRFINNKFIILSFVRAKGEKNPVSTDLTCNPKGNEVALLESLWPSDS